MSQSKSNQSSTDKVLMTLSAISYLPFHSTSGLQENLDEAEVLDQAYDAIWSARDNTNSVYVTRNKVNGEYVLVIKGPVFQFGLSFMFELYDNLEIAQQVHFPYSQLKDVRIAAGVLAAIQRINSLCCDGRTLEQIVNNFAKGSKVYLTGHSLGGTIAAAYAARLAHNNRKELEIIPYTFGAPVAGNGQFADLFNPNSNQCVFPRSSRRVNSRDIIPFAWHDLQSMPAVDYGKIKCPIDFTLCLDCLARMLIINRAVYAAPTLKLQLQGRLVPDMSFFQEAALQHQPNTYLALLGLNPVGADVYSYKEKREELLSVSL
jgi:hypothetical protein